MYMACCEVCGVTFTPRKHNQKYCSVTCRVKKYRSSTYKATEEAAGKNRERVKRFRDRVRLANLRNKDKARFSGNREKVLERDGYRCQACGTDHRLEVHHKDRSGQTDNPNNEMDNLITLCASCHRSEHRFDRPKTGEHKNCGHCGKEIFIVKKLIGRKKYCSIECADKAKVGLFKTSELRNCKTCDKPFKATAQSIAEGKGKYCSVACSTVDQTKRVTVSCLVCGNEFQTIPSRINQGKGKYCSKACSGLSTRGSRPGENEKECATCKRSFPKTHDYFHKHNVNKDGFHGSCKSCVKEKNAIAWAKKKPKILS